MNEKHREKDESKLCQVLRSDSRGNPEGIFYVIMEVMQELDASTKVQRMTHPESDENEDFQEASEIPETCKIEDVGPLLTNQDVSEAIQGKGSSRAGTANMSPENSSGKGRNGMGARKKTSRTNENQENQDPEDEVGIFGTSAKPSKWSLAHVLQSVASTREKRIIALTAWFLAFVGLIVALTFVTIDFVSSRKEMASTVRYEDSESLNLPPLLFCTTDTEFPPFMQLPNQVYRGQPLVWIDYVRGTHSGINVTYPETKLLSQLSYKSSNAQGMSCNASNQMDPILYYKENTAKPNCFYCLTFNQDPPVTIYEAGEREDGLTFSRAATLRIAQNLFVSNCRSSQFGLDRSSLRFFREELRAHYMNLSARGIIDFGEHDPSNRSYDGLLWPNYRLGFQNSTVDFVVYDVVDMFCNVYLFSGFFYPSTSKEIKYTFDSRIYRWKRSGAGPYYPQDYFEYYTTSENIVLYSDNAVIGQEKYENRSMYTAFTIDVRTNHSKVGDVETLATLEMNQLASVKLSRNMILQNESFTAVVERAKIRPGDVRSTNRVFLVEIGFSNFLTRVVTDQQSVSWSAFMADFFGLTSLFMDVSVYTLIVTPLVVRARRRALEARNQRSSGERVVQV